MLCSLFLAFCLSAAPPPDAPRSQSDSSSPARALQVGPDTTSGLPRQSLSLTAHGATHVYEGPTLASVLEKLDAPLGQRLRGEALKTFVVVTAADGYVVVFSLAEIDPAMSPTAVILADEADGAPLSAEEGPLRLVVEGDARPARSVRQVTAIELRRP